MYHRCSQQDYTYSCDSYQMQIVRGGIQSFHSLTLFSSSIDLQSDLTEFSFLQYQNCVLFLYHRLQSSYPYFYHLIAIYDSQVGLQVYISKNKDMSFAKFNYITIGYSFFIFSSHQFIFLYPYRVLFILFNTLKSDYNSMLKTVDL